MKKTTKRPHRPQERGFALIFIVMIVAVVAVAAAALLDIVEVDLLIASEHRRSAIAEAVAEGAIVEIQADDNKVNLLPDVTNANLLVRYSAVDATGDFVRDPDALDTGPTLMTEASSAYVRNNAAATAAERQGYTSDIRLLRLGPAINSGNNTVQVVVYEVRAQSSVGSGQGSDQAIAEVFSYASAQSGTVGQLHGR